MRRFLITLMKTITHPIMSIIAKGEKVSFRSPDDKKLTESFPANRRRLVLVDAWNY